MTKQFVEMSPDALARVMDYAHRGDIVATLVATFKEFGLDLTDPDSTPIKPWDCELPMEQWTAICGALQAGSREVNKERDPIRQVNLMLDWVNKGPSGHTEDVQ